ncbi:DNA polymerase III subunit delta' [Veronia pacifica]|uniref:DNA polymerase III subunit delta' n=1 Tax=Veronia pacifica TaxID=1080227 RepID=A0A1C3EPW7_9GAMM|nr:DNA polymerase III subunit delta' [Veronia pacifica]ODA35275.1 DNA polymerase III subunit delta' [Veronia pacifica]
MLTDIYPWQQEMWQQWKQLLDVSRLHHALLLAAPEGSGRMALAAMLAKTVLCKNAVTEPCDSCHSCQLFEAGNHPDLHVLKPETKGKQIGVDAVRQTNHYAWETSQLGGARVILVDGAELLGEAAANALLKTLEEPPSGCQFILMTDAIDRLLPTIVSRCNKWKANLPEEHTVRRWVEAELCESVPLQVVRLNRGAPLAAKEFIESGDLVKHQKLILALCEYLANKQGLFTVTDLVVKAEQDGLKWLSFLLLDILKYQQGSQTGIIHSDMTSELQRLSGLLRPGLVMAQLASLNKLTADMSRSSGLNRELMISQWLSQFDT